VAASENPWFKDWIVLSKHGSLCLGTAHQCLERQALSAEGIFWPLPGVNERSEPANAVC
jgi:hypothetical protein